MAVVAIVGVQWGDEGKGKIVDLLTPQVQWVIRCQGGANAGHTIVVGDEKYVFHQIPSGVLHPDVRCIIGAGVVLDPESLVAEMRELEARGIDLRGRLFISPKAHVTLPYHRLLDAGREARRGGRKIGTTGRGIGPTYTDKAARSGVRVQDVLSPSQFRERLETNLPESNFLLRDFFHQEPVDPETVCEAYAGYADTLRDFVQDTDVMVREAIRKGEHLLLEGAQGSLLDLDHGTYPYVTSSNTNSSGLCSGAGIAPTRLTHVIGVVKAYATRVGMGPFPTELQNDEGKILQERGREFGATTGRVRRCGWFDAAILRVSARINGLTSIALTRLDVLDQCEHLKLGVGYRCGAQVLEEFPADPQVLDQCEPIYEEMAGWCAPTTAARCFDDLPPQAQAYVKRVAELSRSPVSLISVGPEREATIPLA
jgi:adenylosuccinate synthase